MSYTLEVIKGVEYAVFPPRRGADSSPMRADPPPPPPPPPGILVDTTLGDFGAGSAAVGVSVLAWETARWPSRRRRPRTSPAAALPPGWQRHLLDRRRRSTLRGGRVRVDGARLGGRCDGRSGKDPGGDGHLRRGALSARGLRTVPRLEPRALDPVQHREHHRPALRPHQRRADHHGAPAWPPGWSGPPHAFRIDWEETRSPSWWTGSRWPVTRPRCGRPSAPVASDHDVGGPALAVDWLRLSLQAPPGERSSPGCTTRGNASTGSAVAGPP